MFNILRSQRKHRKGVAASFLYLAIDIGKGEIEDGYVDMGGELGMSPLHGLICI